MPPSTSLAKLVHQDGAMCAAAWHNLFITVYSGAMVETHMDILEAGVEELAKRYPSQVFPVCLLLASAPPPSAAAMRRSQQAGKRVRPQVLRGHIIFEYEGMGSSIFRTLLRSLSVVTGRPHGLHFHVGIDAACAVIAPQMRAELGIAAEPGELRDILGGLRERLKGGEAAAAR